MDLHICVFMCAMAESGPGGMWGHSSEEKSTRAEHLKRVSEQTGRLLNVYVFFVTSQLFIKKYSRGKINFTISCIAAISFQVLLDYAH